MHLRRINVTVFLHELQYSSRVILSHFGIVPYGHIPIFCSQRNKRTINNSKSRSKLMFKSNIQSSALINS